MHGPVIAGDPAAGTALALRSMQFAVIDKSFDCMLPMLRANTVDELYEATRGWGLMDHNLVAGDTTGHIGNRVRAQVPMRPRSNGWLPVPGWTGEHEWQGMIPFEDMPCSIDPPERPSSPPTTAWCENGDALFSTDACRRIARAASGSGWRELPKATVEDMASIHRDTRQRGRARISRPDPRRRGRRRSR